MSNCLSFSHSLLSRLLKEPAFDHFESVEMFAQEATRKDVQCAQALSCLVELYSLQIKKGDHAKADKAEEVTSVRARHLVVMRLKICVFYFGLCRHASF